MIEFLLVSVLIAFIIFVVTWILTKIIGNSPESKAAVAKIFLGFGIVIFVIFILYVAISYIFNLNNGSQINWISFGGSSSTVPFRDSDAFHIFGLVWLGLIMLMYNIFQFIYLMSIKYKTVYDSININDSSQTQSKNFITDDINTQK